MKLSLMAYGVTAVIFLAVDAVWLTTMAGTFYRPLVGSILADQPRLPAAALFYLIYVFGIVYFAIKPALKSRDWAIALINGALLGFTAYATYDLSNQATLIIWPSLLTIVDMAWGTFLTGLSATLGYLATARLARA